MAEDLYFNMYLLWAECFNCCTKNKPGTVVQAHNLGYKELQDREGELGEGEGEGDREKFM